MKIVHWLVLGCVGCLSMAASAQWQWTDAAGKQVFSDKAPPPDVPERSISRRPATPPPKTNFMQNAAAPATATEGAPAAPAAPVAAGSPKPKGVDKELEEKTRKAAEAEKAKQAAEAQKLAQAKSENCRVAQQGKATFDSGLRVARINSQGEREIIDDAGRAAELKRLQGIIDSDCR
ncbi:DUF4124 domain-containing protein [Variovorax sp. J22R133]|uniref:DUF4124 domain-containing protein n=1 Tax=Variovorax brevis TaxID=3053503 RepID=UPI0025790587|nr:DUF4124 domain-containing protein [Variovorax sp. J22R133]MDM0111157.1 DUF4124 domain-containing protein [Variovorax sp. J22R133]